jgi:hypothetical protein
MKKFTTGHEPLCDKNISKTVEQTINKNKLSFAKTKHSQFVSQYKKWLLGSKLNTINGFEKFTYASFSYGTTTAISSFLSRNHMRRIRMFKDDFILTKILSRTSQYNFKFIEDGKITKNDCVVTSLPFTGNGSMHPQFEQLLDQCDKHNVPVLIDGAYFGISTGITYPLDRKCIQEFTTSHSKNFGVQDLRIGIRFSKQFIDDALNVPVQMADCYNKLGSCIGIDLMKKYTADYIINKYWFKYYEICETNNLTPTNTVTLALGSNKKFQRGSYVRVCVSNALVR